MVSGAALAVASVSSAERLPASGSESRSLCEVVAAANDLDGKEVVVRGYYYRGFEISELYCPTVCPDLRTWVQVAKLSKAAEAELRPKGKPRSGVVAAVTIKGGLSAAGHAFGHLGAYEYQIGSAEILSAKIVARGGAARGQQVRGTDVCGTLVP